MPIRISPNRVTLEDARLEQATLKYCGETVQTVNVNSSSTSVNIENGNVIYLNQSAGTTISFNNPSPSGTTCAITILRKKDYGATARTITWPSSFKWPNGAAPTLTQTSLALDVIEAATNDGGTTWQAHTVALNSYRLPLYGYFGGGITGSADNYVVASTDRIVFSSGVTSANTVSNLSLARNGSGGLSDGVSYGYWAGGYSGSFVATADRITFSTGATAANTVSNISQTRTTDGLGDGALYGYFAGGWVTAPVNNTDRVVFSTGVTSANTISNLSTTKAGEGTASDGSTFGYFAGGMTATSGNLTATVDRVTFSTGATAANTSSLPTAKSNSAGISDGSMYGYFAGGWTTTGQVPINGTARVTFSTSTVAANTVSNLSTAKDSLAGTSDGLTYGYFAGGNTSSPEGHVNTADRVIFSTGTTSANTVSNLSSSRSRVTGLSEFRV
jgi:hypothetical protein